MRHINRKDLRSEVILSKDIRDGELFFIHMDGSSRTSRFLLTRDMNDVPMGALGTRIKGQVYSSDYWRKDDPNWRKAIDKAMEQMAVLIMSGWTTVAEYPDDFGYMEKLFRCVYCYTETTTPSGSCRCRIDARIEKALAKASSAKSK